MKKSKIVTLEIPVPKGYRWMAQQPWGTWVAFRRHPIPAVLVEEDAEPRWLHQFDQLILVDAPFLDSYPTPIVFWRLTLKRI